MKYSLYTDGSVNKEAATQVSAYIVISEDRYVTNGYKIFRGHSPQKAEYLAISAGLNAVKNFAKPEDIVFIYSDSVHAIKKAKRKMTDFDFTISYRHVKGHTLGDAHIHTYVDSLAKALSRTNEGWWT